MLLIEFQVQIQHQYFFNLFTSIFQFYNFDTYERRFSELCIFFQSYLNTLSRRVFWFSYWPFLKLLHDLKHFFSCKNMLSVLQSSSINIAVLRRYHDNGILMSRKRFITSFLPSHATLTIFTVLPIQIGRWTFVVPPPTPQYPSTAPIIVLIIVLIDCWERHILGLKLLFCSTKCIAYITNNE